MIKSWQLCLCVNLLFSVYTGSKGVITHHALIKAILMISVYITFKYV